MCYFFCFLRHFWFNNDLRYFKLGTVIRQAILFGQFIIILLYICWRNFHISKNFTLHILYQHVVSDLLSIIGLYLRDRLSVKLFHCLFATKLGGKITYAFFELGI